MTDQEKFEEEVINTPWPDESEDIKEIAKIVYQDHPDGFIGPPILDAPDNFPDDPDQPITIGLNPTFVKIFQYFENKYGEKGQILFVKWQRNYLKLWKGAA